MLRCARGAVERTPFIYYTVYTVHIVLARRVRLWWLGWEGGVCILERNVVRSKGIFVYVCVYGEHLIWTGF